MRVLYYSDIHTEIRESETRIPWVKIYPLDLGPDISSFVGEVDLVILAGDIGTIRPTRSTSASLYAEQVSAYLGCPVVLIPGNHEYYRGIFTKDRSDLLAEKRSGVTFLDRGISCFSHPEGQLRILGATLWTDYALLGNVQGAMDLARSKINDHRLISRVGEDKFRPEDALAEHQITRNWLFDCLQEPHQGPTLIVTHHVPHPDASNPLYPKFDSLAPIFSSDCADLIELAGQKGVVGWIFGHHHYCVDITVTGVRLLSAQLGYPRERTGWKGPGLLEI